LSHLFRNGDHIPLFSLNVGRSGAWSSFDQILPIFSSRPGVVMLQETWLSTASAEAFARQARKALPGYSVFVKRTVQVNRSRHDFTQVITFLHGALAAKATQLDLSHFLANTSQALRIDISARIQSIRTTDIHTGSRILFINLYQFQSDQAALQDALLTLVSRILARESAHVDEIFIGGDWNASPIPRSGYADSSSSTTASADRRLQAWVRQHNLKLPTNMEWTWERKGTNLSNLKRATLDFFLSKANDYQCTTRLSPDPGHDHRLVCIATPISLISPLPDPPPLHRKGRLKMDKWKTSNPRGRDLKSLWQEKVTEALTDLDEPDVCLKLKKALDISLRIAKDTLGVSKPRAISHIPFHSSATKQLLSARRDVQAAMVDIRSRILTKSTGNSNTQPRNRLSRAMRKVWDRGFRPENMQFHQAQSVGEFREEAQRWIETLSEKKKELDTSFRTLRASELSSARKKAIDNALELMRTPGSKAIQRILGKLADNVPAPFLVSETPDSIILPSCSETPLLDLMIHSLAPQCTKMVRDNLTSYSNIPPDRIFIVVEAAARENIEFILSTSREMVCSFNSTRLASIEFHQKKVNCYQGQMLPMQL